MYDHHITNMTQRLAKFLAPKIQIEPGEIAEPLREYWRDYAVHIWHTEDVFFQAGQSGLPMSRCAAREILMEVERDIDCEYGLTWSHIDQEIDGWAKKMRWANLKDAQLAQFSGRFALAWHNPRLDIELHRMVASDILLDAVRQAREIAHTDLAAVRVFSADPDEDEPEDAVEYGNELMVITPPEPDETAQPGTRNTQNTNNP